MKTNKLILIIFILLTSLSSSFGQDGSDMKYVKTENLNNTYIGKFAHLDFYNSSFCGVRLDTVVIDLDNKPTKFIEHRKDNGYNNWFSKQYLVSLDTIVGFKIRLVKSRIDSITNDSVFVTNYFEYYNDKNELVADKSHQEQCWFKKDIICEFLFKAKQDP